MASEKGSGVLFVISAPSGTGKSSLARRVLAAVPDLRFSVSFTTRPPRPGERDGQDYRFVDEARFGAMVDAGAFLEWAPVFGRRYGTGREATEEALRDGSDLLLDIDVQGARRVREAAIPAVSIFILPPDYATLESRLRRRGSEDATTVEHRLAQARAEARDYIHYDYVVVNDDLDSASEELASIVRAERAKRRRREGRVRRILDTFPVREARTEER